MDTPNPPQSGLEPTTERIEADPGKPWKAVAAAVGAGIVAFGIALASDGPGGSSITQAEWWTIGGAILGAGIPAYVKRNPLRAKTLR